MKLFSIVNTFDKKEWTGFLTYVELYHKPKSTVCQVANWLDTSAVWRKRMEVTITAELLLSISNLNIKVQTFSNVLTQLGNIAEEYVGWNVWKDSKPRRLACQLEGLAKKSLTDEYLKTQREVLQESSSDKISIWDDFYKMRALFEDYYFGVSPADNNYVPEFRSLIKLMQTSTAKLAQFLKIEISNRERLLSESWEEDKEIFDAFSRGNTGLKEVFGNIYTMIQHDDLDSYYKLKTILFDEERIDSYSSYIKYAIVSYLIIFLLRVTKQGNLELREDLLNIYEFSLMKGFFILNDTMPMNKFLNIIGVVSKLGSIERARSFVDNWAYKVDKKNSKTIATFGHATIDFQQRKYKEVIQSLAQMKSSDFQHKLRFRWLYLRAQFEVNRSYIDVIKVQLDNFRRFIISNEKRINTQTYLGLKSSIKIINMILDNKPFREIEDYYRSRKYVFERKWIVEKLKNPA